MCFGSPPAKKRAVVVVYRGAFVFSFFFFCYPSFGTRGGGSVGLVGGEQGGIHGLHAGWTGEGSHQPVVYTVHVVDVHARQESDRVSINKVQHTDHTSESTKRRRV